MNASRNSGSSIIAQTENKVFRAYTQPTDSITNIQTAWIPNDYFIESLDL
ncbi:MAG: hypothetical protein WBA23_21800 [Tunicatimonas sp.]